jgi:hypothetical protein
MHSRSVCEKRLALWGLYYELFHVQRPSSLLTESLMDIDKS